MADKGLRPCDRSDACRLVEFHPVINDDDISGDGSGQKSSSFEMAYDEGGVDRSFSYHETSFTVTGQELCSCADFSVCPDENSTDTETSVKLDSFVSLKLCRPKKDLPICRDHKRPVVRIFKDSPQDGHSSVAPYVKARIWCNCASENFPKSRYPEVWARGMQLATAYRCSPYKH